MDGCKIFANVSPTTLQKNPSPKFGEATNGELQSNAKSAFEKALKNGRRGDEGENGQ